MSIDSKNKDQNKSCSISSNNLFKNRMISANCNTLLNGADYSDSYRCLAYTSSSLVHIYDPFGYKTNLTLKGHKQRVNAVKFIDSHKNKNDLIELLSCSGDGTVIHWINKGIEKNPFDFNSWSLQKTYKSSEPNQPVNLLDSLYISPIEKYFVIFSASGKLDLFYFDVDLKEYKMFHTIQFKKKLQDAVCLTVLDDNYLMLLTGGYDSLVHVYTVMRVKEINKRIQEKQEFSPCNFKISLTGHLNDIRAISAISPYQDDTKELFFATCSQDTYIRVWHTIKLNSGEIQNMAETINQKGSLSVFDEYKSKTSYVIKTESEDYYNIVLDSVLSGHEESVSSIKWGYIDNKPVILSSSFDFTVGIWKFDEKYNLWNKDTTLGEMVGNKHSFFSAMFVDNFNSIIAYTYNGAFYFWKFNPDEKLFRSQPIVHGHFGPVSDLDWDSSNKKGFLVTTSEDQTTRIFAEWKGNRNKNDCSGFTWHEINRPQIHGYDINTISCLTDKRNQPFACKLVAGADEKILREFDPPFNLVKYLQKLSDIDINFSTQHDNSYYEKYYANIEGSKQALGLMTKQVRVEFKEDDDEGGDLSAFNPDEMLTNKSSGVYTSKHDYSIPPDEDFLTNNTLWPESNKLYGHGYEIICLAVSNDGKYIASGGKAQSEKHSKLFLWNAEKSNLICKLDGHILTIVQIEFSNDDEFILTVSRDRSLCLYKKNHNLEEREKLPYLLVQVEKETHGRIIWGCSWNYDSSIFITGSRDTFVKIWSKSQNPEKLFMETLSKEFASAVTSVNIVPFQTKIKSNTEIIIIGFESGEIELYTYDKNTLSLVSSVHNFLCHGATVKRIKSFITEENQIRVASCSDDHSVRIFDIDIENLKNLI